MFGLPDGVAACLFDVDGVVTRTEDALAGVAAGRAGGFALVVGVDRVGQARELRDNGADIVVQDVAELLGNDGRPDRGAR